MAEVVLVLTRVESVFSGSEEYICFAIHLNKHRFDKMIFLNVAVFNPDQFYRLTRLFSDYYKAQTRENTNWFEPQSSSTRQDSSRNAIRLQQLRHVPSL